MRDVFDQPQAKEMVVLRGSAEEEEEEGGGGGRTNDLSSVREQFPDQKNPAGLRQIAFRGNPEGLGQDDTYLSLPPSYAQHTQAILREVLGKTEAEIDSLKEKGAVV